ncbi:hypothetical protein [Cyanobacterium aponinum]|uniref:Uncharacterized protein n=1 Tax=Cyanobacterium aponinum (strain PCC 10605) TaxID=755178 RepID=K9Z935_CYAAP|nr:hypothetical protein [Cyanobacterium aponinum]AFZ54898.1 hypothetical protein Cyan10605_2831 [Cyanobacterium aponinum PCC 10605]
MNNFTQSIIILNRRKKQVSEELEEAKSKLLMWSKRVNLSLENNRFDLLKEASLQENLYIDKVKSLESQLSQLSTEIDKTEQKQSRSILPNFQPTLPLSDFEKMEREINDNDHLSQKEELDIEEEIKLIKNYLKYATNALEKLESKVLKNNKNQDIFDIANIDDELEELRKQLRE